MSLSKVIENISVKIKSHKEDMEIKRITMESVEKEIPQELVLGAHARWFAQTTYSNKIKTKVYDLVKKFISEEYF